MKASINRKKRSFLAKQIKELNEKGLTVEEACKGMGMAETTYFTYKGRGSTPTEVEEVKVLEMIRVIHKDTNGLYGYRRMPLAIKKYFHYDVLPGTCKRVMNLYGLPSNYHKKKPRKSVKKTHTEKVVDNLMDRDFEAEEPLMKWCSDVTDLKVIGQGKPYHLCTIIDLFCNHVLAWTISEHNDSQLVLTTLKKAVDRYGKPREYFHTDQGSNYTSLEVQNYLEENGITASMSRLGTPLDNAVQESWNGVFKALYELETKPAHSKEELIQNVEKTINFYTNELVTERFGVRSIGEIYTMNLEILRARERGEDTGEIEFFPIQYNPTIGTFWSKVLECPLWELKKDYKGMIRLYKKAKKEEEEKAKKVEEDKEKQ